MPPKAAIAKHLRAFRCNKDYGDWNAEELKKELDKYKIEKKNENGM